MISCRLLKAQKCSGEAGELFRIGLENYLSGCIFKGLYILLLFVKCFVKFLCF